MDIQFSHHCGENIELSEEKHRASWTHRFSGGIAFSSQQLQNNNNLKLDLAGTGHAYVGVVTRDPSTIINMRETLARDVLVAKEMKVHKRLGAINITPNIKDGRAAYDLNVVVKQKYWIVVLTAMFGCLCISNSETL